MKICRFQGDAILFVQFYFIFSPHEQWHMSCQIRPRWLSEKAARLLVAAKKSQIFASVLHDTINQQSFLCN